MVDSRRHRYARLLRWYPSSWRAEHGIVILDSLEQHATERGIARPTAGEAWSLRAHGLGARATDRWATVTAAAALLAFMVVTWAFLGNALLLPGGPIVSLVLGVFVGPVMLALSGVVLLYRAGQVSAPAALCSASFSLLACAFAALTAASWSIGFDEADSGPGYSWFGSSTIVFLLFAWAAGTAALLPPASSVLKGKRTGPIRLVTGTVFAAVVALVIGVAVLMGQQTGVFGAIMLLVVALTRARHAGPASAVDPARSVVRTDPPGPKAPLIHGSTAGVVAAALVSASVGLGCAVFALTGSEWVPGLIDSTRAMNLGLAAGALAVIPVTVAAGYVLARRYGDVVRWSAAVCCASLALEATAQFLGVDHPLQWPLMVAAAALMGIGLAFPFGRVVPGRTPFRIVVIIVLGLAGSFIGLLIVTMVAFIAPLGAAVLLMWSRRRRLPALNTVP